MLYSNLHEFEYSSNKLDPYMKNISVHKRNSHHVETRWSDGCNAGIAILIWLGPNSLKHFAEFTDS